MFAVFFSALAFTASYRVFGACSRRLDVALRYCGILLLVCTLCGGYVRSVENLISEAPWVGWLAVRINLYPTVEMTLLMLDIVRNARALCV